MTALAYATPFDPLLHLTADQWQAAAARDSLPSFTRRMVAGYIGGHHIEKLQAALEAVERGELSRLIVTMPPRHSKSLNVSENFPAWYLGRHPDQRIIAASHTAQLAYTFSRRVRNKVGDPRYPFGPILKGQEPVLLADDKGAVQAWDTNRGGGYIAVGAGGSPTGHGGNILIDDPIRSAADADSQTIRDALWEWYQGTMRTRLQPGGWIIVTACMTGDTEVTMADGSAKCLRDIQVGDAIATYEQGRITTSHILNWINHGPDFIYEIRMKSGKIVRANERHPFLVDDGGELQWVRVRDLKPGHRLIRCKGNPDIGESGEALPALTMDATNPPSARDTATPTTVRRDGPAAIAHHLSTTNLDAVPNSSDVTALPLLTMTPCLPSRVADVPSAESAPTLLAEKSQPIARMGDYSLTTATTPARFEGSSVTSATSLLGTATPLISSFEPLSTFEITPDEIITIVPAGVEDVFDIEVERTENFIANGVVSHNTRWHEDDLTGRLLTAQEQGGEQWHHLHLPAVDEAGNALWPEFWPVEALSAIRQSVGSRVWDAQYQGRPAPAEGGILKRHWFDRRYVAPEGHYHAIIQAWDTAFKVGDGNDNSACVTIGLGAFGIDVLDVYQDKLEFPDLERALQTQHLTWSTRYPATPITVLVEDKGSGQSLIQSIRRLPHANINVIAEPASRPNEKVQRVNDIAPTVEANRVRLPADAPWLDAALHEWTTFPFARHDDATDAFAIALRRAIGLGTTTAVVTEQSVFAPAEPTRLDRSRRMRRIAR